jgi:hypothetical protein
MMNIKALIQVSLRKEMRRKKKLINRKKERKLQDMKKTV